LAEAAEAEARKNGWKMAIAVVSNEGSLIYFGRMEDTQFGSSDITIRKAKTAARVPPSDQGVPGCHHRHAARASGPERRSDCHRRRAAAAFERQDHRRNRLQRRHPRSGRAGLQGRRGYDQVEGRGGSVIRNQVPSCRGRARPGRGRRYGSIVVDILLSVETAKASLDRYYQLLFASGFTTSRAQSTNSFATGLRSRFFSVTTPIGLRVSGKSMGSAFSDPR